MYRNACQRGLLTIFFGGGTKPLSIWETKIQDGYVSRFLDQEIKSMVLEIGGTNISTTYMACPKGKMVLGIAMPFLVMVVRNLKKYFSFEVTILDDTGTRRRFRVSNFQSSTQILPLCTVMPISLSEGWNQIQFNLAEFTRRAYKKQFVEVQRVKVNANIRIRRIYFAERLLPEEQLPPEYKLYVPITGKPKPKQSSKAELAAAKDKKGSKQELAPPTSKTSVAVEEKTASKTSIKEGVPAEGQAPAEGGEKPAAEAGEGEQEKEEVAGEQGEGGEEAKDEEVAGEHAEGGEDVQPEEGGAEPAEEVTGDANEAPPESAEPAAATEEASPEVAPEAAPEAPAEAPAE